jgi:hypothetical protein
VKKEEEKEERRRWQAAVAREWGEGRRGGEK